MSEKSKVSRRDVLKLGSVGALGLAGSYLFNKVTYTPPVKAETHGQNDNRKMNHSMINDASKTSGYLMAERLLTEFDYGTVTKSLTEKTVREYTIVALDQEIEIAKGIKFPGWTFNRTIPSPTLHYTESDLLKFHFTNNGRHLHSIHFHGIHPPEMDGIARIYPGQKFTYEFEAKPYGITNLPLSCITTCKSYS